MRGFGVSPWWLALRRRVVNPHGWLFLCIALCCPQAAWADAVWQFVDRDGVVHMGNAAPPQTRGLVWIDQPPLARAGQAPERGVGALKLPGYKDAKPHLEAAALSAAIDPALVIAVAAAEAAVGLAIIIVVFRGKMATNVDQINILKW